MCPATTYESTKESTLSVSTEVQRRASTFVLSKVLSYESSFKTVPKVRVRVYSTVGMNVQIWHVYVHAYCTCTAVHVHYM
jgi:hypothetical protein